MKHTRRKFLHVAAGAVVLPAMSRIARGVLEDWCLPYSGYHFYYPSRRQSSAACVARRRAALPALSAANLLALPRVCSQASCRWSRAWPRRRLGRPSAPRPLVQRLRSRPTLIPRHINVLMTVFAIFLRQASFSVAVNRPRCHTRLIVTSDKNRAVKAERSRL
jgi:hypothetical protein